MKLASLITATALIISGPLFAQTSLTKTSTGDKPSDVYAKGGVDLGGGVVVNINDRPALRDLVDKTTCRWVSAKAFQEQYAPATKKLVQEITAAHWYLGDAYSREINRLKVCMTGGPLKEISVEDQDGLTIYSDKSQQVGIRLGNLIFIDMTIFQRLATQQDRDFLFMHEVSHSFIPFYKMDPSTGEARKVPRRNDSLRSHIRMLSEEVSSESIANSIEANQLDMPATTRQIDYYKDDVLKTFNPLIRIMERGVSAKKVEAAVAVLWASDAKALEQVKAQHDEFSEQLFRAIREDDIEKIKYLYSLQVLKFEDRLAFSQYSEKFTGLEVAMSGFHGIGSLEFFLQQQGGTKLEDLRTYAQWHGDSYGSREEKEKGRIVLKYIPANLLKAFSQDPEVKKSRYMRKILCEKMDPKAINCGLATLINR